MLPAERIQGLRKCNKIAWNQARALMQELIEGVLAVRSRFAPIDGPRPRQGVIPRLVSRLRGRGRRPSGVDPVRQDPHLADRRDDKRRFQAEHIRHMAGQRRDHSAADDRYGDDAGG